MDYPSNKEIQDFINENQGVASVGDLAEFLDVSESEIRDYARDAGVRRLGTTFAFDVERTMDLVDHLSDDDDDGDEVDDTDDEEDDDDDGDADDD